MDGTTSDIMILSSRLSVFHVLFGGGGCAKRTHPVRKTQTHTHTHTQRKRESKNEKRKWKKVRLLSLFAAPVEKKAQPKSQTTYIPTCWWYEKSIFSFFCCCFLFLVRVLYVIYVFLCKAKPDNNVIWPTKKMLFAFSSFVCAHVLLHYWLVGWLIDW